MSATISRLISVCFSVVGVLSILQGDQDAAPWAIAAGVWAIAAELAEKRK